MEPVEPISESGFGPFIFLTSSRTALPGHAEGTSLAASLLTPWENFAERAAHLLPFAAILGFF
jgi:hypothetical protein